MIESFTFAPITETFKRENGKIEDILLAHIFLAQACAPKKEKYLSVLSHEVDIFFALPVYTKDET